jgi:hypothetical protein
MYTYILYCKFQFDTLMLREQTEYPRWAGSTKRLSITGFGALIGLKTKFLPLGIVDLSPIFNCMHK